MFSFKAPDLLDLKLGSETFPWEGFKETQSPFLKFVLCKTWSFWSVRDGHWSWSIVFRQQRKSHHDKRVQPECVPLQNNKQKAPGVEMVLAF